MRGRTGRCLAETESVGAPSGLHEDQFGLDQSLRTSAVPLKLLDMQRVPFLINLPKVERGLMSKPRFCTLAERNLKKGKHVPKLADAGNDQLFKTYSGFGSHCEGSGSRGCPPRIGTSTTRRTTKQLTG